MPTRRPDFPLSALLLLLLTGCGSWPSPVEADMPTPPGADSPGDPDTADTAAPADWSAVVGRRLDAEASAFHPIDGGWRAAQSLMGLDARVSDDRVVLVAGTDEVTLRTRGVHRDAGVAHFSAKQSGPGACVASGHVDAAGVCIQRIDRVGDGLVEWWASTPGAVQVGWDIATPPAGDGPLAIRVEVEGAGIRLDEADGAATFVGPTREVGFSGLVAWDADGEPLDAWMETDGGALLVRVDDEGARYPIHVDPFAFTAGWSQSGSSTANFGRSVSVLGDVNFDGYDDVAVGAPAYSSSTGRVYVYHGSSSGLSTSPNVTLTGPSTGSYFGRAVSGAGDVNADGFDDLVVGADGVSAGAGAAYVYYGSSTGVSTTAGVTLTGAAGSSFGYAVAAAGDVNGDRFDDVIVGAYTASSPLNVGAAYVFHGATSGLSSTAVTTLTGSDDYSSFGIDVAGAGDVNADGYDDIVVGASTYGGNTGYVVIHHGAAVGVRTLAARRLTGAAPIENFGASVSGAGDVNGDGYDDVVIGAWGRSSYYGGVEVYHGSATGVGGTAATAITGPGTAYFGFAVSGAGDMDDDGYDDIVVGGYLYSASAGLVRTFRGSDTGMSSSYEGTVTGSTTYCLGYSVGGGGDLNGDGYSDIVAGGYCASSGNGYAAAYYGSGDADGDGYSAGAGVASASRDCDDDDPLVNPGVTDTIDDGVDNNCDGQERCYDDDDNDGYLDSTGDARLSTDLDCADSNEGSSSDPTTDCDDGDSGDYPGALETIGNADDENCDGGETCYEDDDDDGYLDTSGDTLASTDTDCNDAYEGRSGDATTDCDDNDASDRPGATEIVGNADDDDCDGLERCYDDDDDDGYLDASGDTRSSTDLDCDDANEGRSTDATTDCDDTSATDYPGAVEIVGNGDDESCDGLETCYDDDDNDGYLDRSVDTRISTDTDCADAYEGTSADLTTDCDDTDSGDRPGATETVGNGDDEDCDGGESCYVDRDDDGYLAPGPGTVTSADGDCDDAGEGLSTDPTTDCDDSVSTTHPGATEQVGDGIDGDCDSAELCYADLDVDTYSGGTSVRSADLDCSDAGEVTASGYAGGVDCDDGHAGSHPGGTEVCDEADRDEDCDGTVDDADASTDRSTRSRFYADDDGDGRGDDGETLSACDAPAAYVATAGDCDDARVDVYAGAAEAVGDGVDSDCDGGEVCYSDADGDSWATATRVASADADCADAGEATAATAALAADCDDADASVNPGAVEVCDTADTDEDCDGAAEDADGSLDTRTRTAWHLDVDGDTYGADAGSLNTCNAPLGYVADGGDCDDADAAVNPGAAETPGDALDADCDGQELCYADADLDGWADDASFASTNLACDADGEADATVAARGVDCLDSEPSANPGSLEECDDRDIDEDCDGLTDDADPSATGKLEAWRDADADGYGAEAAGITACDPTDLYALVDGDCDDADPDVSPSAVDVCNGVDDDCDGDIDGGAADAPTWYPDGDGDGYGSALGVDGCEQPEGFVAETGDCDDTDALVNPGAEETCNDLDDDCDGDVELPEMCDGVVVGEKSGCGCDAGGGPASAVAAAGLLLALARRRRS